VQFLVSCLRLFNLPKGAICCAAWTSRSSVLQKNSAKYRDYGLFVHLLMQNGNIGDNETPAQQKFRLWY